jgi:hypothetical protein
MVDIGELQPGAVVVTTEGRHGRVKELSQESQWVLVEPFGDADGEAPEAALIPVEDITAVEAPVSDTLE